MPTRRLARLLVQQHKQLVDSRASVAIAVHVPVDQRLALGLLARALSALWATVRARAGLTLNTTIERMHCRPWGLAGGHDGAGNEVWLKLDGREVTDLPNAKVLVQRLKAGDTFTLASGGGGGFGNPAERDPDAVASDVAEGYVTAEEARTLYRVALTSDGSVDGPATRQMRSAT